MASNPFCYNTYKYQMDETYRIIFPLNVLEPFLLSVCLADYSIETFIKNKSLLFRVMAVNHVKVAVLEGVLRSYQPRDYP